MYIAVKGITTPTWVGELSLGWRSHSTAR